jgi:ribosomal protein S18 acetylase RimI-like enzyme
MLVRALIDTDYAQFLELIRDFRDTTFTEDEFKETLRNINATSDILVLEISGILVATGTVFYEQKFIFNRAVLAHVEDVCVKKEYRRQGYGTLIIQSLLERARTNRCYKITLDCASSNVDFYTACGFEVRGHQMSQLL